MGWNSADYGTCISASVLRRNIVSKKVNVFAALLAAIGFGAFSILVIRNQSIHSIPFAYGVGGVMVATTVAGIAIGHLLGAGKKKRV
jgi:hypothetical protein